MPRPLLSSSGDVPGWLSLSAASEAHPSEGRWGGGGAPTQCIAAHAHPFTATCAPAGGATDETSLGILDLDNMQGTVYVHGH